MTNKNQNLKFKRRICTIICLLMILIIAGFFRLWKLDSIPPGIYPDEAINGLNALETAKTNNFQAFYPDNNGREGLWINLTALVFKLAPPRAWSLRLISVIFGTLTILGLYLMTKELLASCYSKKRFFALRAHHNSRTQCIALTAAFLLAISFWHINFSRIAFRAILTPFLMVFSFYFLWRYFRLRKISNLIISAVFFGLGFYTYIAFRMAVVLLAIAWLLFIWRCRHRSATVPTPVKYWHIFLYVIVIFLVSLPLAIYFYQHPEQIMGRATEVAIWRSESPIKNLVISTAKTLGMFNIRGDYNWRHNFSGRPQLLWPVGILFLIGLIYLLRNIWLSRPRRNRALPCSYKRTNKSILSFRSSVFLLSWFLLMLLPAVLTAEGLPHALRALGVIPVVYIFASLGLIMPYQWIQTKLERSLKKVQKLQLNSLVRQIKRIKISLAILVILILLTLAVYQYNKYFILWSRHPETAAVFSQDFVAMGEYLNSLPDYIHRFVIVNQDGVLVNGIPMPAQTIKYVTYGHTPITYLLPDQIDQIQVAQEKKVNAIIILMAEDNGLVKTVQERYPQNITGTYFGEFTFISI